MIKSQYSRIVPTIASASFMLIVCALCSIVLHKIAITWFPRWNLLDSPKRYNLQRNPIPYPTGIISVLIFCIILSTYTHDSKQALGVLSGIVLLAIVSFIDDRTQISSTVRILFQLLVAIIIFGAGTRIYSITSPLAIDAIIKLDSIIIPFAPFDNPPVLSGIFTIIWLILTMNALNWFDGIPGQVNVISIIGFAVIGLLALSDRIVHVNPLAQESLAIFAFSLSGLSLGAALFDFPPPKVVMGDTGAMFFGLMFGVLTIYSGGKVATALLVLGVPLIDSIFVIVRRLYRKKAPWKGNAIDEHLHHRLLLCGWSPRYIICTIAIIGSTLGISALFMSTFEKFIAALLLLLVMIIFNMYTSIKLANANAQA